PVEEELAVNAKGLGQALHWRDAGAHHLGAPAVEELAGPGDRRVVPQKLQLLLEQVGAHRSQVVLEQVAELAVLLLGQVLGALEQRPATALEHGLVTVALEPLDLRGPDLVDRLVEALHDVEAVEHVHRPARSARDDVEVWLVLVAADEPQPSGSKSEPVEEALQALLGAV